MIHTFRHKQAFTLVEVIVAFTVLITVILASTDLLVAIIRSNTENVNTLIAYGLSQEGLEAMRNVRDSNWLLGADFQGMVDGKCLWPNGGCLPIALGSKKDFSLKMNQVSLSGVPGHIGSDAISQYAPWELKDVTPSGGSDTVSDDFTKLYVSDNSDGTGSDDVWYQPCFTSCTLKPSLFSRYIEVEPMDHSTAPGEVKKYRVSSVVQWKELGRPKEVRLTTEITDWKGGAL